MNSMSEGARWLGIIVLIGLVLFFAAEWLS